MTPQDALSSSPPTTISPPQATSISLPNSVLSFAKKSIIPENIVPVSSSEDVDSSLFPSSTEKKGDALQRSTFDYTKGNWGSRIVLTTYPGQSNVGKLSLTQPD
jgi:hypothetical protein